MKKLKGFSIAEILILFLMFSVFMAMTLPIMTVRKKESGGVQKNVMSLISNQTLIDAIDISGDGFTTAKLTTLKAAYPAAMAIEEMTWGDSVAINTLKYYLESTDSTATQKTNAKKVMRPLCDLGNNRACLYFVIKCAFNNECDVADSDVDLNYYLIKDPESSTNGGLAQITKYGKIFYAHYSKLITAVDNTCCLDSSLNEACAIKDTEECAAAGGAAYCWGQNIYNMGSESTVNSTVPVAVTMPAGVSFTQIAAGDNHVCALTTMGSVYCWGYNINGQLGNNSTTSSINPTAVIMPDGVTFSQIYAGSYITCGLTAAGKAYCWGLGSSGQMGNGTTIERNKTPVAVTMPSGQTFIKMAVNGTVCAITTTGLVYCWGNGYWGNLGNGEYYVTSSTPLLISALSGYTATDIASGQVVCVTTSSGDSYCWGYGENGGLGNGTIGTSPSPVRVTNPSGKTFSNIVAGNLVSAITSEGLIYYWGAFTSATSTPTLIATFPNISTLGRSGSSHNCGITADGKGYCWGYCYYGQMGNGSTSTYCWPTAVSMPTGKIFTSIASGSYFTCAIAQ